ncbi:hypothetical protein [Clostridium cadaveris]
MIMTKDMVINMIKIKIDKNKREQPSFKIHADKEDREKYLFLKRALMEAKSIKGIYEYEVPLKYFLPIINNLKKEDFHIDEKSIEYYFEFSDEYEGEFFYTCKATADYMKLWREETCPEIFKVRIDFKEKKAEKIIAFKKIDYR